MLEYSNYPSGPQVKANEIEGRLTKAWHLFHDSFSENGDELVKALDQSARLGARIISPMNLSATVSLLRELERPDMADKLIDYFIDARSDDDNFFDLGSNAFASHVSDVYLVERLRVEHSKRTSSPGLAESIEQMATANSWTPAHMAALSSASESEFYEFFRTVESPNLAKMVSVCLSITAAPNSHVAERASAALRRIAAGSTINKIRLRRFGISEKLASDPETLR